MANSASLVLQQNRSLRITRSLGQAIDLLKFSNRELSAFLAFHDAVNPHLSLDSGGSPPDRMPARAFSQAGGSGERIPIEQIASPSASLHEHARKQAGLLLSSARELAISALFIEALEPTGWLGRSVQDIAREAGCDVVEAEAVLMKIQRIDPPGLFARSLAECLRLQAEDAEVLSEELSHVLDNLPLLASGEFAKLAEICGCSPKDISAHFATIRGFNPKPGVAFGFDTPNTAPPDLIVVAQGGDLKVELNRSTLPNITISESIGLAKADQRMLEAAKAVARAVERRNISTLQIASEVVHRQSAFLREGPGELRPLSLRDVADATGVHESTVSRITSGLRIDTPRGPLRLRDFFSGAIPANGAAVSSAAVRAQIAARVEAEDPARPMSDAAIAAWLAKDGIVIARRTVAKYRGMLRVPSAPARRKTSRKRRD